MKSYRVLLYPVVWVKSQVIQAESPEAAAQATLSTLSDTVLARLLNRSFAAGEVATHSEYSEQIESILVDELDLKGEVVTETDLLPDAKTRVIHGGEHALYTREGWRQGVMADNTQLGYWEWVQHRVASES